jgi:Carboxypeptidase regulatory-like domain/TonB-dependent Receptor Plug Domain
MKKVLALALGIALAFAGSAIAQIATGNVYGTVKDESGAVTPGVNVTINGPTGTRSTVSGPDGHFRFLGLNSGDYTVNLGLTGFAKLSRKIRVTLGENVELAFTMKVSSVEETVMVTGETPLVDSKKRGTSTTMTTEELQNIPNARDPWAVLRAVPGVLVDRVNIAGNENGQQASTASKGSGSADRMWNLDGVVITDMSATGASPTYFDFDAFSEISVTTTGADLTTQGYGASINLTTKRGTNAFHGSGRYYIANNNMSFNNLPSSLANDPRIIGAGLDTGKADHLRQTTDYGFDVGGPIVKDKLWFYGTWGKQDIRNVRLNQTYDKTLLPSYNFKVNWQAAPKTMVSAFYFLGSKQKFGRANSKAVQPDDSFLWNQDNAFLPGGLPGGFWKVQIDQTFSPNFFVSVKGAYYDTGFSLSPRGGTDQAWTVDYVRGEGIGSYIYYSAIRPQKNITVDANYFFDGLGGNNELKFGFAWRDYKTISTTTVGGNGLVGYLYSTGADCGVGIPNCGEVEVARVGPYSYGGKYYDGYLGDTLTKDRLTVNAGVRLDIQKARNDPATVVANPSFPGILPDLTYDGNNYDAIKWTTWSPRVGMSYALNESRTTVLRASYAMYGNLLAFGDVSTINPISYGAIAYGWNDFNGDRFVQPNEVDIAGGIHYSYGVNLSNPGSASPSNRIDSNYKSPKVNEFAAGIDHEVTPGLAMGVNYTYRHGTDYAERGWVGTSCDLQSATAASCNMLSPADYTLNAPTSSNGFSAFTYSPNAALRAAGSGGRIRTNRDGYSTSFSGIELTLTKRLSNRWMSRVAFSWNDWTEDWSGTPTTFYGNPGPTETDPLVKGGQVALLSGGSGKASFYSSTKWQFYANALYQGPWGLDFSGNLFGRQGGAYPIDLRLSAGGDGTISALATPAVDTNRYDTLWDLDVRLAKTVKFSQGSGLTLSAEWFNVFNSGTVLSRYRYANSSAFTNTSEGAASGVGRIEELMAPSVFRLGVRLFF